MFLQWFNAFQTLKFVHFLRDNYFPLKKLEGEAKELLKKQEMNTEEAADLLCLLNRFREIDCLEAK